MPIEFNFPDPPKEIGSCLVVETAVRVALHRMFMMQYAPQQKYRVELQIPETAAGKKARAPYCMGGKLVLPLQIRHNERSQSFPVLAVIEPREGADVEDLAKRLAPCYAEAPQLVTLQKSKPTPPRIRVRQGCGTAWASCREVAKFLLRLHNNYGEESFPAKEVVDMLEGDALYEKITVLWGRVRALELGKWIRREHEGKRYSPYLLTPTAADLISRECSVLITTKPWPEPTY